MRYYYQLARKSWKNYLRYVSSIRAIYASDTFMPYILYIYTFFVFILCIYTLWYTVCVGIFFFVLYFRILYDTFSAFDFKHFYENFFLFLFQNKLSSF